MTAAPPRPTDTFPEADVMAQAGPFLGKVLEDMAGALATAMAAIGDRLELFGVLADGAPVAVDELAARAGINPAFARDWLQAMACAGYLERVADGRFVLPGGHAVALAFERSPFFLGGAFQQSVALVGPFEDLLQAVRNGDGLSPDAYGHSMAEGMDRMSGAWLDHQLVPGWIPAAPAVHEALRGGGRVADLGCGSARALLRLAEAFPACTFVGFDFVGSAVARARKKVAEAGLTDRVTIEHHDVTTGLPGRFDVVTMFDLLHDVAQPAAVLEDVRNALTDEGACLVVEANAVGPDATGPVGTILYATSVLYCVPTALSWGADGLGTMGLGEEALRDLGERAGFATVRRLPAGSPFNAVYELVP